MHYRYDVMLSVSLSLPIPVLLPSFCCVISNRSMPACLSFPLFFTLFIYRFTERLSVPIQFLPPFMAHTRIPLVRGRFLPPAPSFLQLRLHFRLCIKFRIVAVRAVTWKQLVVSGKCLQCRQLAVRPRSVIYYAFTRLMIFWKGSKIGRGML